MSQDVRKGMLFQESEAVVLGEAHAFASLRVVDPGTRGGGAGESTEEAGELAGGAQGGLSGV